MPMTLKDKKEMHKCPFLQRSLDERMPHIEGFQSVRSQLKYVAAFLRSCYIEKIISEEKNFTVVLQRKLKQVLSQCSISTQHFFVTPSNPKFPLE